MKLSVVPCPPVVEVLVKRPDVKYQLGFSVQNGVVCIILITCLFSVLCTKSISTNGLIVSWGLVYRMMVVLSFNSSTNIKVKVKGQIHSGIDINYIQM